MSRLINTGNIEQNVFFVKTQFFDFVAFFTKKSSNQNWSILPKWRTQNKLNQKEGITKC